MLEINEAITRAGEIKEQLIKGMSAEPCLCESLGIIEDILEFLKDKEICVSNKDEE